jgi:hypothetical protein
VFEPLVEQRHIAGALKEHRGDGPVVAVAADQTRARARLGVVGALHAHSNRRTRPQPTRAGCKAGLVEIDQRPLFSFGAIAALEKVLTPHPMVRLERLRVQQRFFYN